MCEGFICKEPEPRRLTVEPFIDGKNQIPHVELQTGISRNRNADFLVLYVQLFFVCFHSVAVLWAVVCRTSHCYMTPHELCFHRMESLYNTVLFFFFN